MLGVGDREIFLVDDVISALFRHLVEGRLDGGPDPPDPGGDSSTVARTFSPDNLQEDDFCLDTNGVFVLAHACGGRGADPDGRERPGSAFIGLLFLLDNRFIDVFKNSY
jgi:hypothetical protein